MGRVVVDIDAADLRRRLGLTDQQLPDDPTSEQIAAAFVIAEQPPQQPPQPPGGDPNPPDPNQPPPGDNPPPEQPPQQPGEHQPPQQIAAGHRNIPPGMLLVDETVFAGIQQDVQRHTQLERRLNQQDRDTLIAEAVSDGKFPPSRKDHYTKLYEADPEGTKEIIANLQPNVIPVEARGTGRSEDWNDEEAYPSEWLPEITARQAPASESKRVVVGAD